MKRELWIATIAVATMTLACGGKSKAKAEEPAPPPPAAVENTVVAEEPPPPPPAVDPPLAAGSTGVPACDEYLWLFDQVVERCADKMGPALDAMKQAREAQREAFKSWDTLDGESRKATLEAVGPGCKAANDALRQSAVAMECALD